MYTWVRAKLNQIVREEINTGKKIVVCPYGECGMILVDLLEKAYGIEDVVILDNGLAKYNSKILPIMGLKEIDTKGRTLILTSISLKNNEELERQIKELDAGIKIRNILKPEIREAPQKALYFQDLKSEMICKKIKDRNFIRIGNTNGDGGYVMIDDFDINMRAYSFGIGNDVSWDMDIANRKIKVFMYDHTIYQLPQVHQLFQFNRLGIGSGNNCFSLEEFLEKNNDLENYNLILKMDIEGAEWDVLNSTSPELLKHFRQITLELHDVCRWEYKEKILNGLCKLNLTHQTVWLHGNNANRAECAGGILMPNLLEVTFARRDAYLFESESCIFPMPLDVPNLGGRRDFALGNWGV